MAVIDDVPGAAAATAASRTGAPWSDDVRRCRTGRARRWR